jgi:excisionase family DNA binding protein
MIDRPSRALPGRRAPSTHAKPTPLLSVQGVAEFLDVSTKTVRRLIANGVLKAHRIGGSLRISEEDLRAYLARCR